MHQWKENVRYYNSAKFHDYSINILGFMEGGPTRPPPPVLRSPKKPGSSRVKVISGLICKEYLTKKCLIRGKIPNLNFKIFHEFSSGESFIPNSTFCEKSIPSVNIKCLTFYKHFQTNPMNDFRDKAQ